MKNIQNINKIVSDIQYILENDEIIRTLVGNQIYNPFSVKPLSVDDMKKHKLVTNIPIITDDKGKAKSQRGVFIVVYYQSSIVLESETENTLVIGVYSTAEHFIIEGNQTRNLLILDRIEKLINNGKFAPAGRIELSSVNAENINSYSGLVSTWRFADDR